MNDHKRQLAHHLSAELDSSSNYVALMSRADATQFFNSGVRILLDAGSNIHLTNYDDLLLEATQCFDRAVSLTEEDDPSYGQYAQFCASAHATCLSRTDCSLEIDGYINASPLFQVLSKSSQRYDDEITGEIPVDDNISNDFWDGLDEVLDRCSSGAHPNLFSAGMFAAHVDSFSKAITHCSDSVYLEEIWCSCRATVLYMRMEQYNPNEVAQCIVSMLRVIQINESASPSPANTDHTLLQTLQHPSYDISLVKTRLSWLSLLATFYTHK